MKITKVLRLPDRLELVATTRGYVAWSRSERSEDTRDLPLVGDDVVWGRKHARWTPQGRHGNTKSKSLRIIKVHALALLLGCWTCLGQQPPPYKPVINPAITGTNHPVYKPFVPNAVAWGADNRCTNNFAALLTTTDGINWQFGARGPANNTWMTNKLPVVSNRWYLVVLVPYATNKLTKTTISTNLPK